MLAYGESNRFWPPLANSCIRSRVSAIHTAAHMRPIIQVCSPTGGLAFSLAMRASRSRYFGSSGGSSERGRVLTMLIKLVVRLMRVTTPPRVSHMSRCSPARLFTSYSISFTRCAALDKSRAFTKIAMMKHMLTQAITNQKSQGLPVNDCCINQVMPARATAAIWKPKPVLATISLRKAAYSLCRICIRSL